MKYRGGCKVLSYAALKGKEGEYWKPVSVPEAELYIQGEEPVFPLRIIAEEAVRRFEDPELANLKEEEQFALPWVAEHIPASRPRPRHAAITFNRMLEIGPTLSCVGCRGESNYHTVARNAGQNSTRGMVSKPPKLLREAASLPGRSPPPDPRPRRKGARTLLLRRRKTRPTRQDNPGSPTWPKLRQPPRGHLLQ